VAQRGVQVVRVLLHHRQKRLGFVLEKDEGHGIGTARPELQQARGGDPAALFFQ